MFVFVVANCVFASNTITFVLSLAIMSELSFCHSRTETLHTAVKKAIEDIKYNIHFGVIYICNL
jgi:hypothetical protein